MHRRKTCSAYDTVAGRRAVGNDVTGGLAAQDSRAFVQARHHIAIADRDALERDALRLERTLGRGYSSVPTTGPRSFCQLALQGNDVEQIVAVDELSAFIDHRNTVAVAVESDPELRAECCHRTLQVCRRRRAASVVDVATVRRAADADDVGPEVGEYARRHLVSRAVRAVHDDAQTRQIHVRGHGLAAEGLVAIFRVVATLGATEARGVIGAHRLLERLLDARLQLVGELAARSKNLIPLSS